MEIPSEIKKFITKKIKLENFCLPHFYPNISNFSDFQIGYKVHGNTGEKITGENDGDFKESWYVICSGYSNNPFFIDMNEKNENYPVYSAWQGAGSWQPIKVSKNIAEFGNQLEVLKKIELSDENTQEKIKEQFDLNNEFWLEVYNEYEEYEDD